MRRSPDENVFSTDEVLERLEALWHKEELDGMYTRANVVHLAIEEIKRLRDEAARHDK